MALIAAQQVDVDGLNPTMTAAAASQEFTCGDDIMLYISNADASSKTCTVTTPGTVQGQAVGDVPIVVPAGERRIAGPFPRADFAAADGNADIVWSATTAVTFAVIRL
jgi:hypothetical protein